VPEVRRLWRPVVADLEVVLAWSHWRRRHQWVGPALSLLPAV